MDAEFDLDAFLSHAGTPTGAATKSGRSENQGRRKKDASGKAFLNDECLRDDDFLLNWKLPKLGSAGFELGAGGTGVKKFDLGQIDFDFESNLSKFSIDLDGLSDITISPQKTSKKQGIENEEFLTKISKSLEEETRNPTPLSSNRKILQEGIGTRDFIKSVFSQQEDVPAIQLDQREKLQFNEGKQEGNETQISNHQTDTSKIGDQHVPSMPGSQNTEDKQASFDPNPITHENFGVEGIQSVSLRGFLKDMISEDAQKVFPPFKTPSLPNHTTEKRRSQKRMIEQELFTEASNVMDQESFDKFHPQMDKSATSSIIMHQDHKHMKDSEHSDTGPSHTKKENTREGLNADPEQQILDVSAPDSVLKIRDENNENMVCEENIDQKLDTDREERLNVVLDSEIPSNMGQIITTSNHEDLAPIETMGTNSEKIGPNNMIKKEFSSSIPSNSELNSNSTVKVKPSSRSMKRFSIPKLKKLGPIFPKSPPLVPTQSSTTISKNVLHNDKPSPETHENDLATSTHSKMNFDMNDSSQASHECVRKAAESLRDNEPKVVENSVNITTLSSDPNFIREDHSSEANKIGTIAVENSINDLVNERVSSPTNPTKQIDESKTSFDPDSSLRFNSDTPNHTSVRIPTNSLVNSSEMYEELSIGTAPETQFISRSDVIQNVATEMEKYTEITDSLMNVDIPMNDPSLANSPDRSSIPPNEPCLAIVEGFHLDAKKTETECNEKVEMEMDEGNESYQMALTISHTMTADGVDNPNESMYFYLKRLNDESQSLLVKAMISTNRTCMMNSSNYLHYISFFYHVVFTRVYMQLQCVHAPVICILHSCLSFLFLFCITHFTTILESLTYPNIASLHESIQQLLLQIKEEGRDAEE